MDLDPILPTRDDDDLFPPDRTNGPGSANPARSGAPVLWPVADTPNPRSVLFGDDETPASSAESWRSGRPKTKHASNFQFLREREEDAPEVGADGLAQMLYREKVLREELSRRNRPYHNPPAPAATEGAPSPVDGEANSALDFLSRAKRRTRHLLRLHRQDGQSATASPRKLAWVLAFALTLCLAGIVGSTLPNFGALGEKIGQWKRTAIEWLEPGTGVFDYLPSAIRPEQIAQRE